MTDRQVTESSIGLAGRLSYIPYRLGKAEDCGWQSTRNFTQNTSVFKEVGPYKTWFPASSPADVPSLASSATTSWQTSQKQQKWLLKAHPEAHLGNECIHDELLSSHSSDRFQEGEQRDSSLFAVGELTDTSNPKKISGAPLIAVVTGEAKDILRLAKPSTEKWQWGDDDSISLRTSDMTETDESILYREEELTGPIRRLKAVVDPKRYDPTRWIVVQRDSGTRIFRPEYRRTPTISNYTNVETHSRIAANPSFSLSKSQTGGSPHSDTSFNPGVRSKPPQFGLIDECGFWSIWDVVHIRVKTRKPRVSLSKCGHIEKGVLSHLPSGGAGTAQWHKILWVGYLGSLEESQAFDFEDDDDVPEVQGSFPQLARSSTLLLCNSKLLRLLDLTNNTFLPDLPLLAERGRDSILDVHTNPQDAQYIFVLTTSKLLVVRIYSTQGQDWGEVRKNAAIVLSVSHFRDNFDQGSKLAVTPGTTSSRYITSLVSIYSRNNTQIDFYCMNMLKKNPSRVSYHRETVSLDAIHRPSPGMAPQSICLHPAPIILKPLTTPSAFAQSLVRQEIRFYQFFSMRRDTSLVVTLCASASTFPISQVQPPNYKISQIQNSSKERRKLLKYMTSHFVVPDDIGVHSHEDRNLRDINKRFRPWPAIRRPLGMFYEYVCTAFTRRVNGNEEQSSGEAPGSNPFDYVRFVVERAIRDGTMSATTLFGTMEDFALPTDLSHAAAEWDFEIEQLGHIDPDMTLVALKRPFNQVTEPANSLYELFSAFLNLAASSGLSQENQSPIQEARFAVFRQMACDVYLSLFGLVHRQIESRQSQRSLTEELESMAIESQSGSRMGSVSRSQSEVPTSEPDTPRIESQGEDPAMALLRSYTGTGKYVPAKRTMLLDKWEVGANPDTYVFDLERDKEVTPGMQKRIKQLARENRKRRRAETLLQMHKDKEPTLPATQPAPDSRFFNQHSQSVAFSSQTQALMSDPLQTMSQPIPGVFGRREERPKKKVKKRKGGF
ncbi:RNA polymerase I-specific transcription-initiation factor-domain-containing protein [Daldinia caldariorum]|uniref:RNA polymerase I-specific transcription-initiation factor-domain-containing protein n=1 Tax=Daldinia caldariorum TaxID=326644 RepID=UPI002008C291|nr:RNA polymerase I-specific transcription-initiation factor-domain-containing protein [Daldinia caldariorum]KAI1471217.1 RNA polymerase I-specific transcription-initiation factor-domain-containing protein [Daldinia caldariorum]